MVVTPRAQPQVGDASSDPQRSDDDPDGTGDDDTDDTDDTDGTDGTDGIGTDDTDDTDGDNASRTSAPTSADSMRKPSCPYGLDTTCSSTPSNRAIPFCRRSG